MGPVLCQSAEVDLLGVTLDDLAVRRVPQHLPERRDQAAVDLDGDQFARRLAEGARQRAQAGPDLDHQVLLADLGFFQDASRQAVVNQEILAQPMLRPDGELLEQGLSFLLVHQGMEMM